MSEPAKHLGAKGLETRSLEAPELIDSVAVCRVPGATAFFSEAPPSIPLSLSTLSCQNKALQERVLIISMVSEETYSLGAAERPKVPERIAGTMRLILEFGSMEHYGILVGRRAAKPYVAPHEFDEARVDIGRDRHPRSQGRGQRLSRARRFSSGCTVVRCRPAMLSGSCRGRLSKSAPRSSYEAGDMIWRMTRLALPSTNYVPHR